MLRLALFAFTGFVATFHQSLTLYILSSFIGTLVGEQFVGFVYAAGAILSFFALLSVPRLVRRFSPVRVAWGVVVLEFLALLSLAYFYTSPFIAIPALLLHLMLPGLLWYAFDLILKRINNDNTRTGQVRTVNIALINTGAIVSQLVMGSVLGGTEAYQLVFLLSALTLIPTILLLALSVGGLTRHGLSRPYVSIRSTFACLLSDKNTRKIFLAGLLLQTIFTWLVIFAPLYFHQELGIPWEELSWVFAAMLVPYVFIEPVIGFLEDRFFAEREFMAIGFLIIGISMMGISFVTGTVITPVLVAVMLTTRVGAAFVEAASESYFFKHMGPDDENSFGLYRSTGPIAYLVGPFFGTLVLFLVPFAYLFVIFGVSILVGIPLALSLKPIHATKEGYSVAPPEQAFARAGVQ